jgi:hypothetical protein
MVLPSGGSSVGSWRHKIRDRGFNDFLEVFRRPPASTLTYKCALDDQATGQDLEARNIVIALHDLQFPTDDACWQLDELSVDFDRVYKHKKIP